MQTPIRLAYGPHELQFGDLRLPADAGPHPLAIVIHGGFWRAAFALDNIAPLCDALATAGIATWNLEYRRIGNGGGWPTTFEDVALGARFITELAARYPVDAAHTIAIGHSAGGHLALLLGAHQLVRAVVSLAGVADLRRAWELNLSKGVAADFLGGSPDRIPDVYNQASPIALVPTGIPVRLIHGSLDDIVPLEISERYAQAARAAGDHVDLVTPHANHRELIDPQSPHWPDVLAQIRLAFEPHTDRISAIV